MKVSELLHLLRGQDIRVTLGAEDGVSDTPLLGACFDSRRVSPGELFCALDGRRTEGRRFLAEACARGAAAVLLQGDSRHGTLPHLLLDHDLSAAEVARIAAEVAHQLAGRPSASLWVGAVTGTNGKSTVVHLVESALNACGIVAGGGGTLGLHFQHTEVTIHNTTPSADILHQWMRQVVHDGGTAVVFEASSVGIEQHRIGGIEVDCAAWTNLSHDHLDLHHTMEAYAAAKARLFLDLPHTSVALLPAREDLQQLCAASPATSIVWGLGREDVDLAGSCRVDAAGLRLSIRGVLGRGEICSRLIGAHNAENLLLAFGMLRVAGVEAEAACRALEDCDAVPGRLQRVAPAFHAHLFVDYAHSPAALEHVLQALHATFPTSRVGVVFGAGGDRDRDKRGAMGRAVGRSADWCVVTSDNPRNEDPQDIADAVLRGVEEVDCPVELELDRRLAILLAVARLHPGEVLLLAGKGHETYQEIRGVRHAFDDRVELEEAAACSV